MADFKNPKAPLASQGGLPNLKFERDDWTSFRNVEGLQQKAGVPASKLRRLVLKELADNALDDGAIVHVGELPKGGYFIEDDGPGIDGTPEEIARLFSINRPMVSTKSLRLPTRGALGNGLRVVAGSVLASGGSLTVITGNKRIELKPEHHDGSTTVVKVKPVKRMLGTRIEIGFGEDIPIDVDALYWANAAIQMAHGQTYAGRSSPYWYDVPQFYELLRACGTTPVRELVANLDGCTGARAGEIVTDAGLGRMVCRDVSREQATRLLTVARSNAKEVTPKRLGAVGPNRFPALAYATSNGTVLFGTGLTAEIPFVVEAWAGEYGDMRLIVCVNRTPVTGDIEAARDKREIDFYGCGLHHNITAASKDKSFTIRLNIITPYMPITSDGKEPDLEPFLDQINDAVAKAVKKAIRPGAAKGVSQKSVVLDNLDDAIAAQGGFRFNQRQLFYFLRPIVMDATGRELKEGNFSGIITDHENEYGEIEGMYREPRGSITHPHRDETITLGTLMVEEYERPAWNFNKVLYIEKEGAQEALKQDRWMERHDIAVMSSKGFSTRAARDLIDKLAEHDEPVTVFCVHDADASGPMIYQTLQEATKARGARKIQIINLGLEPWEAIEMGLEVEPLDDPKRAKPVADYIRKRPDGDHWADWLQTHRVELNTMTTPQLIAWLDAKMAKYGDGKLIPPHEVLEQELAELIEAKVREDITERVLREARIDDQVADAVAKIKTPDGVKLARDIAKLFKQKPDSEWREHIRDIVVKFSR